MRFVNFVVCAACLLVAPSAFASLTQFNSRLWQAENGLPNNIVQAIAQTRDSYLWVGTREGLARFDGDQFYLEKLSHESTQPSVLSLLGGKDGTLWVGTENSGIFKSAGGALGQCDAPGGNYNLSVYSIKESVDGRIWFGTSRGVMFWNGTQMERVTNSLNVRQRLCTDNKGHTWALDGNLKRLDSPTPENYAVTTGKLPASARSLYCDADGIFWMGSDSPPVSTLMRLQDGTITTFPRSEGPAGFVSIIFRDSSGELWIGSYAGLSRFVNSEFESFRTPDDPSYRIYAIFEDRERNLWIGSEEGLTRLTPKRFKTLTKKDGLSLNTVVSVCPSRDGGVWIGTWGRGIDHYLDGRITSLNTSNGLKSDFIMALAETHDGSLWAGVDYGGPLHQIKDGKVTAYGRGQGYVVSQLTATVALCEGYDGLLWIGDRMSLLTWNGNKFARYTTKNGLCNNNINSICKGADGNIWIGTEGGLTVWHDGEFTNLAEKDRHLHVAMLSLYEDAAKTLWIGTKRHGLLRRRDGVVTGFTREQGLFSDAIYSVLEDSHTNLWLNSSRGIFRVSKQQFEAVAEGREPILTSVSYGKADGILASGQYRDVTQPAACKDAKGWLWFRTTQGVVLVDPDLISVNDEPPPVVIQRITADSKSLFAGKVTLAGLPAFEIPPGRGDLEIQYAALSYRAPEKNLYRYRLIGSDLAWVDAGNNRITKYNNLPPGRYRFEVRASNNDGIWNENGQSVSLILEPHFWQTWWFLWAVALIMAGLVAGMARYITHRRMRRKLIQLEQQHAVEEERMRIARDVHDELGSKLTWISFQGGIAKCSLEDPIETRRQIDQMSASAREAVSSLHEIIWAADPENDSLDGLIAHISHHTGEFFGASGINCEVVAPEHIPSLRIPAVVRHNLFLALKEAMNNAAKHASATRVLIQIFLRTNELEILISDNGSGFHPELNGDLANGKSRRTGYGLSNMRKRLQSVDGRCEINSEVGQGTTIRLVIAVEEAVL